MGDLLLTIQHQGEVFSPPVKDDIQIEWERTGTPGKLTFTVIKTPDIGKGFQEGDQVCFYYKNKLLFVGYVFTKVRDKDHHIKVTCYDQLRYLKNKFSYIFVNKKAGEIIKALAKDFNLQVGEIDDTGYVIPSVAEENTSAFDIILSVLEDTLLNTGQMFVLYDNAGKLTLKNAANMQVSTLIDENTAENFDYTSSIDKETYNSIILYYKGSDNVRIPYTASKADAISKWGTLRYFEEIKHPTIAQNKADSLLKLYCRRTRELKIKEAFGSVDVRAGSLIPVRLNLGDIITNNYMMVSTVTHKFTNDHYSMDLTLEGTWGE